MKGIKGFPSGKNHHLWKGKKVSYKALHGWVCRVLGRPSKCEECGTTTAKRYHWANISGEYKRDFRDWKRLCVPCHVKFDGRIGQGSASSKLTERAVRDIKITYQKKKISYKELAEIFDVGKTTIAHIVNGRTWRHIQ